MKTLISDIKNIGVRGAVSNAVADSYYGAKGKYAIASREAKSKMRNYVNDFEDEDDNKTSPEFAEAMGFDSVEECDKFFDSLEE